MFFTNQKDEMNYNITHQISVAKLLFFTEIHNYCY